MNKEQQDLAWKCLPRELRDEIKGEFKKNTCNHVLKILTYFFGSHNLTSNTEPEEMLTVERSKIQEMFDTGDRSSCATLAALFGDKCLPDKEESKPKFDIGQKVVMKLNGSIRKISSRQYTPKGYKYFFEGFDYTDYSFDQGMEPYTEEKTMKVKDYSSYLDRPKTVVSNEPNLCELLKGCDDEIFYNPLLGNVTVMPSNDGKLLHVHQGGFTVDIAADGTDSDGNMALFPSKEQRNWMEWKESRKPKYILQAEIRLISLDGRDVEDWEQIEIIGVPDIDLSQAGEEVKEFLMKFHDNPELLKGGEDEQ